LQSAELIPEALKLKPKVILFGFYFGNDLMDNVSFAESKGELGKFVSLDDIAEISRLEAADALPDIYAILAEKKFASRAEPPYVRLYDNIRAFLSKYSRLYVLLRSFKQHMRETILSAPTFEQAVLAASDVQKPYISVFSGGGWKTIFWSPYRLHLMRLSDARVRSGLIITEQSINEMDRRCKEDGARFIVVLLPNKEFVFRLKVSDPRSYRDYEQVTANEDKIKLELVAFFLKNGIEFVDPLEALRKSNRQPYFENADEHPNVIGHEIIASVVGDYLREQ
jgi:hypothetical protein